MKIKKVFGWLLLLVIALTLVACDGAGKVNYEELLSTYLLNVSSPLTADFTLDSKLKIGENEYDLKWTSSDECVKIDSEAVDGAYTVTVTRPNEQKEVTLTVELGGVTKEFKFQVNPYDVYDFTGKYVFKQEKTTVSSDFALDTEFEQFGKKCTISWESLDTDYITISDDGKTAQVLGSSVEKNVTLKATFSYNGEISAKRFVVTVYDEMDPMELIDYWYKNTGVSQTLSGYVVVVGTIFSATYNNISLYMIDDSLKAGYYLYRVGCTQEVADKLAPGVHVTVTGTTNTSYSGLMETNAGGQIVVDDDVEKIDIMSTVVDFDSELTSKSPSAVYRQSTLVKLNGWKITEKTKAPTRGATTSILKIERDGVTITVDVSKYLEGYYSPWDADADPKFDAIVAKYGELEVGDYIDITGILGNYNGHQVHVIDADLLVKSSAPNGPSLGAELAGLIESTEIPAKISDSTSIALPAGEGDATVTWALTKESKVAKVENGKLVITPGDKAAKVTLVGTYVNGDFSTAVYYSVTVGVQDNTVKTIAEAKALDKGSEVTVQGTVMATSARGYILYDGTDAVYVYANGSTVDAEKTFAWKAGDTVKVAGKMDYYNVIELVPTESVAVEIEAKAAPDVSLYNSSKVADYVAADKAYPQDYAEFTGVLTVSGNYFNVGWDGVEAQVSLSYLNDDLKAVFTALNEQTVTFRGYTIGHSSNKYLNVMVTEVCGTLPVSVVKLLPNGTEVTVEGKVVALSSRGYVVYDGKDAIYVYAYGSAEAAEKAFFYEEGDYISVTGAKGFYNGAQIVPTSSEYLLEYEEFDGPEAEEIDEAAIRAYVAAENTEFANKLVKVTGKVLINNGYYNVLLSAEGEVQVSLSYLTDEQKAEYENDKEYTIYGWTIGQSSNKYMNIIPCTYIEPLGDYVEVYEEGALYVNLAFTETDCSWGGTQLTFGVNGFNDIKAAVAAATEGQTIYLQSGEYVVVESGGDAFAFDKSLKFVGPNADIPGYVTRRYEDAIIKFGNNTVGATFVNKLEFVGCEVRGNAIGYVAGHLFDSTDTSELISFTNCVLHSSNTFISLEKGTNQEVYVDGCYIHGINQFFVWIRDNTANKFTLKNSLFDAQDCGQVASTYATMMRVRAQAEVKIYHNVFIGDELNNGYFEPSVGPEGSFDVQYNEFRLVTKFIYKFGDNEKITFNNNIYTDGDGEPLLEAPTLEVEGVEVTKDENIFESKEALEAAWLAFTAN